MIARTRRNGRIAVLVGALSWLQLGCNSPAPDRDAGAALASAPASVSGASTDIVHLSIVELIASPEKHQGAKVAAVGFFVPSGEPPHGDLYLDRESARMLIRQNAIHVRFGPCTYVANARNMLDALEGSNQRAGYANVTGVFEPNKDGRGFPWASRSGQICSVMRFVPQPLRNEFADEDGRAPAHLDAGSPDSASK